MTQGLTVPHRTEDRPVRTIRVRVVGGPDQGQVSDVASEIVTVGTAPGNDIVLTDPTVSRYHMELTPDGDQILVKDHGSTNGISVGPVRIREATVARGTVLRIGKTSLRVEDGERIQVEMYDQDDLHGLKGRSAGMRRLMAQIKKVSKSDASVLLLGETGTGKEVIARAVHQASPRANKPMEIVDCGALMPTLVASELFGHEKGAFTGANNRHIGAFERADGGTVFLDEIGELPANLQVRLLGVLERRSFRRVGGTQTIEVDVRVVSATHRDLRKWVNNGEFRQDLYYRIAVARLNIPSLQERLDDIPILVEHFLHDMGLDGPVEQFIPPAVMDSLRGYHWPGNVRELRNFVESAVAFGEAPPFEEAEGPSASGTGGSGGGGTSGFLSVPFETLLERPYKDARDTILHDFQGKYFRAMLEKTNQNVSQAAAIARMNRPHLIQLLKRHGIR